MLPAPHWAAEQDYPDPHARALVRAGGLPLLRARDLEGRTARELTHQEPLRGYLWRAEVFPLLIGAASLPSQRGVSTLWGLPGELVREVARYL